MMPRLTSRLAVFLRERHDDPVAEALLPDAIGKLVTAQAIEVAVHSSAERWVGLTYQDDLGWARAEVAALHTAAERAAEMPWGEINPDLTRMIGQQMVKRIIANIRSTPLSPHGVRVTIDVERQGADLLEPVEGYTACYRSLGFPTPEQRKALGEPVLPARCETGDARRFRVKHR